MSQSSNKKNKSTKHKDIPVVATESIEAIKANAAGLSPKQYKELFDNY